MRTVELSDEEFAHVERAAAARGMSVAEWAVRKAEEEVAIERPPPTKGRRLEFPLIRSDRPGTLKITKEKIDQIELEDYLGRGGSSG